MASCEDNNCTCVLGISNLQEPIPSMDAHDHLSIFQSVGVTDKHRIAWVAGKPNLLEKLRLAPLKTHVMATQERNKVTLKATAEKVVTAYGEALLKIGGERKDIVVLDADLSADCGLRPFEQAYPDRFIENGIAEQDMVSTAGGLALHGFLPIWSEGSS